MTTKEEIVHAMCATYRHNYGLDHFLPSKAPENLWNMMLQIYNNSIEPYMEIKNDDTKTNIEEELAAIKKQLNIISEYIQSIAMNSVQFR